VKAFNAQQAGAAGVVLYNNVAGFINPSVAMSTPFDAVAATTGIVIAGVPAGRHDHAPGRAERPRVRRVHRPHA
jgi:minor extracellular serine protease Vpr